MMNKQKTRLPKQRIICLSDGCDSKERETKTNSDITVACDMVA